MQATAYTDIEVNGFPLLQMGPTNKIPSMQTSLGWDTPHSEPYIGGGWSSVHRSETLSFITSKV